MRDLKKNIRNMHAWFQIPDIGTPKTCYFSAFLLNFVHLQFIPYSQHQQQQQQQQQK